MIEEPKSPENHSATRINKLYFLLPILFTILLALIYSQLVVTSQAGSNSATFLFEGYNEVFIALNIAVITIISTLSLLIFFRILRTKRALAIRVLVSSFIMGGMLSALLFGKHIFLLLNFESPLFLLVVAFVGYIGTYFAYLAFIDALSDKTRNALFLVCSGTLGSFLGILVPVLPVIVISLFLSVADTILISRHTVEDIVGETQYERLIMKLAFSNKEWGIGIGDLTCYSMIVANTSVSYGAFAGSLSLLLILIGAFFSLLLAMKMIRVPGLPISAVLGLLPSISLILNV